MISNVKRHDKPVITTPTAINDNTLLMNEAAESVPKR